MTTQGIGPRVLRKEDARHLHGRGSFVSDMMLPGQSEVAFLRSPIAHGRIRAHRASRPAASAPSSRATISSASPTIVAPSDRAGLQDLANVRRWRTARCASSARPSPCASRRRAPRPRTSCEQIELDIDELPVLVDAQAARADTPTRVHERVGRQRLPHARRSTAASRPRAKGAPVVVKREIALARQAMVPMEGKAVLAYWDDRADQLMVYTSTQVPHMIRVGLARVPRHRAGAGARDLARRGRRLRLQSACCSRRSCASPGSR